MTYNFLSAYKVLQKKVSTCKMQRNALHSALNTLLATWVSLYGVDWNIVFPALDALQDCIDIPVNLAIYDAIDREKRRLEDTPVWKKVMEEYEATNIS